MFEEMPAALPWWESTAFWLYLFAWLPFALFVAYYGLHSPWRESRTGRGLMAVASSITTVLTFVLIVLVFPLPTPVKELLRALTLGAVGLSGWLQFANLRRLQKHRNDPVPHRRSTDH